MDLDPPLDPGGEVMIRGVFVDDAGRLGRVFVLGETADAARSMEAVA